MRFIGREKDMEALEALYRQSGFRMLVLYGRRRVGKTRLLGEFVKKKKAIYFTGVENQGKRNLDMLSKAIYQCWGEGIPGLPSFETLPDALEFLTTQVLGKEDVVLVIDEYPYFAKALPEAASVLQQYIDLKWSDKKLFLILSGSSMSYMQDEVLSEKSPLFGRRSAQLALEPLDYLSSAGFIRRYRPQEQLLMYAVTGGIPKYLELFDAKKNVYDNIADLFFTTRGYLFEEPENLLKQELREIATHNAVIECVANGAGHVSEITVKTKLETAAVSYSLKTLMKLGIVKKEYAITDEKNKKKTHYEIADGMFRFWYRFVPNAMEMIAMGEGHTYFTTQVKPVLTDYLGKEFENLCRGYLMHRSVEGKTAAVMMRSGRWWGTDPQKKQAAEIDIVCINPESKEAMIGECRFREDGIRVADVEKLRERGGLIKGYQIRQYAFFSKKKVSPAVKSRSPEGVLWFSLEDIYNYT